jgi:hypothetical protein
MLKLKTAAEAAHTRLEQERTADFAPVIQGSQSQSQSQSRSQSQSQGQSALFYKAIYSGPRLSLREANHLEQELAECLERTVYLLISTGRMEEACAVMKRLLRLTAKLSGSQSSRALSVLMKLVQMKHLLGDHEEARELYLQISLDKRNRIVTNSNLGADVDKFVEMARPKAPLMAVAGNTREQFDFSAPVRIKQYLAIKERLPEDCLDSCNYPVAVS